jgi:hypothetical protein
LTLYLLLAGEYIRQKLGHPHDMDLEPLCGAIEALADAEQLLDGNVNISLVFQQLAVRLERLGAAI